MKTLNTPAWKRNSGGVMVLVLVLCVCAFVLYVCIQIKSASDGMNQNNEPLPMPPHAARMAQMYFTPRPGEAELAATASKVQRERVVSITPVFTTDLSLPKDQWLRFPDGIPVEWIATNRCGFRAWEFRTN